MSTILVRVCLDRLKLKSESFHSSMENLECAVNIKIDYDVLPDLDLLELIKKMPEGYRTIFNLYVIEGYDHNEIGRMLGIKSATSRSQFYRSKQWIRESMRNSEKKEKWTRVS